MRAAVLLVPFLLLRFGLMAARGNESLARAAHFAPMQKGERAAYWVYQLSTVGLIVSMFFLNLHVGTPDFWAGVAVYAVGLVMLAASAVAFCAPDPRGLSTGGIYRFSRNPMYLAYDLIFLGCGLMAGSWVLLGLTEVFAVSGHWIIKAEERWCLAEFGEEYRAYMQRVRRYF